MHIAFRSIVCTPLAVDVELATGEFTRVDTTIPNLTIKSIYKYGGRGQYYTGVCFEGGQPLRKQYFAQATGEGEGYKGTRQRQTNRFYKGVDTSIEYLYQGKVSLYRKQGLEADDLLYSLVKAIKAVDTKTPIDIITNDSDILPLVDEQVSVYMRGTRTHAEPYCPEHKLYYQVTPKTWDDYLSYTSAYSKYKIPYNSMLLYKLIKGDKSDNIEGATKGYGGVKYTNLMNQMIKDGVDFATTFRYGKDFDMDLHPILARYFDADTLEKMKFIYNGVNLIQTDIHLPTQIELGLLNRALVPLKITVK
jgi:DNA polymerase-1